MYAEMENINEIVHATKWPTITKDNNRLRRPVATLLRLRHKQILYIRCISGWTSEIDGNRIDENNNNYSNDNSTNFYEELGCMMYGNTYSRLFKFIRRKSALTFPFRRRCVCECVAGEENPFKVRRP